MLGSRHSIGSWLTVPVLAVGMSPLAGCGPRGSDLDASPWPPVADAAGQDSGEALVDAATTEADSGSEAPDASSDLWPPGYVPRLDGLSFVCKLISDRNIDDSTPNQTHYRANLRGTDLGIPVAHQSDLYFFFGDTAGAQEIWPLGPESLPDAVGYSVSPSAEVAANPGLLCSDLRFLVTGWATGSVESDFAGGYMIPPSGRGIDEFVHNPAGPRGANMFPNMPGDFEVPSGAFSYGGSIYVFYTIINHDPFEMRGSYLAKWASPSTGGLPNYDILYHVDQRFDANGPLRGDFINVAALVREPYVYLYGTGQYRASPVHLARKLLDELEVAGGIERYDASTATWIAGDAPASPVVATPSIGELSVQYFPEIQRYVMLDQEVNIGNRIAARFAESPEGPWSQAITVATMSDPLFAAQYCCLGTDCPGQRMFECDRAGFYGTYMLPDAILETDGSISIAFLVSTWIPYNVALMTARFK